jgi:hypothetical protein
MIERYLPVSDVRITDATGVDVGSFLSSFRYNPTISAYELRGPRDADPTVDTIPDLTDRSPLHVTAMGRRVFLIHFEAVTRVPFEVDVRTRLFVSDAANGVVEELVILRGARVETIPIPSIEDRQREGVPRHLAEALDRSTGT